MCAFVGFNLFNEEGQIKADLFSLKIINLGSKAVAEAAVHSMTTLFDENSSFRLGLLLGDGDNAFNRINRSANLWNVSVF